MSTDFGPGDLREISYGFRKSRILLTAFELGVFTELGDEEKSAGQIANVLNLNEQAVARLMNALCVMGLLIKSDGRYRNTPNGVRYLIKGRPEYVAGLMHTAHLWDRWSHLTETVRTGHSPAGKVVSAWNQERQEAFIAAMHWRGLREAEKLAKQIDLSRAGRLLDLGGGSGAFSFAFVRANDRMSATVFDLSEITSLTRQYIDDAGLAGRVSVVSGNYLEDELPHGFDMIFLSAVIHSNSSVQCRNIFRKCYGALNPGGRILIRDFIIDEDRISPAAVVLFSINMLVATKSGDTYTESEITSWLTETGFLQARRIDPDPETHLIEAVKAT